MSRTARIRALGGTAVAALFLVFTQACTSTKEPLATFRFLEHFSSDTSHKVTIYRPDDPLWNNQHTHIESMLTVLIDAAHNVGYKEKLRDVLPIIIAVAEFEDTNITKSTDNAGSQKITNAIIFNARHGYLQRKKSGIDNTILHELGHLLADTPGHHKAWQSIIIAIAQTLDNPILLHYAKNYPLDSPKIRH